jgi:hypothetical protein
MRPLMDNDILRWLPRYDAKLFRRLRPWPYDEWMPRFRELLRVGTIRYRPGTAIIERVARDGSTRSRECYPWQKVG